MQYTSLIGNKYSHAVVKQFVLFIVTYCLWLPHTYLFSKPNSSAFLVSDCTWIADPWGWVSGKEGQLNSGWLLDYRNPRSGKNGSPHCCAMYVYVVYCIINSTVRTFFLINQSSLECLRRKRCRKAGDVSGSCSISSPVLLCPGRAGPAGREVLGSHG